MLLHEKDSSFPTTLTTVRIGDYRTLFNSMRTRILSFDEIEKEGPLWLEPPRGDVKHR